MSNARLYRFWADLTDARRTGKPQNEIKQTGKPMFDELYSEPARLEQFMNAMKGISAGNFHALAQKFDFSKYQTVCDVGGATDLPVVGPIAERAIAAAGLSDRVTAASGDFFADPLPKADVITMGLILHDWNLDRKMHLIRSAYDALPRGRRVHRHREPHRRCSSPERVRADDVAQHADRVRRRLRPHRRRPGSPARPSG